MKPLGAHKTTCHVAGHQDCGICRPHKKGERALETRMEKKMIEEQIADDNLGLMQSPSLWPQWPLLPLISKTHECGFLIDCQETPFRVYKGNMWEQRKNLYSLPYEDFDSLQSILNNGWRVD